MIPLQDYIFVICFFSLRDGEVEPHLVIFSYKPWFLLSGEVNCHDIEYWSAENPELFHEFLLLDKKLAFGV
jgi:hypothetical protein